MAKLFELSANENSRLTCAKLQVVSCLYSAKVKRAKCSAKEYGKSISRLQDERNIFDECKTHRPQRKYRNRLSSEQAGTCSRTYITDVRFGGSYIHVATRRTYITELK